MFGTLAALLYGAADFFGGLASRRAATLAVTATSQAAGLVLLLFAVPFFGGHLTPAQAGWAAAGGVCGGAGIALLYRALAIGKMGVVSPITAVLAATFPIVVGIVRGDDLRWFQLAGIAVALVAVVLISLSKEETGKREFATAGVKEAIASGIAIGLFFLMLGVARRTAGLDALVVARAGSIVLLGLLAGATRTSFRLRASTLRMVFVSGALDMSANVLYVLAAQTGKLAIAAVLASLYPASTVFLARIVLNERLANVQKAGVALALLGVALIAA